MVDYESNIDLYLICAGAGINPDFSFFLVFLFAKDLIFFFLSLSYKCTSLPLSEYSLWFRVAFSGSGVGVLVSNLVGILGF